MLSVSVQRDIGAYHQKILGMESRTLLSLLAGVAAACAVVFGAMALFGGSVADYSYVWMLLVGGGFALGYLRPMHVSASAALAAYIRAKTVDLSPVAHVPQGEAARLRAEKETRQGKAERKAHVREKDEFDASYARAARRGAGEQALSRAIDAAEAAVEKGAQGAGESVC